MEKRHLGKNHLQVSAIGLGCWGMSHAYGIADETESLATINHSLDQGINFLDTADVYGNGHNEILISKALKKRRREVVVATKFGFVGYETSKVKVNGRPEYVQKACENSLMRMNIDEIDLYYFHRLDPDVPIEETVGAMAELCHQGKVRFLGLSEVSAATLKKACAVHPITALQSEYSLWQRDIEKTILPACQDLEVSLVPFCPLGRGFLTGKIKSVADLKENDYRSYLPRFDREILNENVALLNTIQEKAAQMNVSLAQLSLAWILAQDASIVPIPGMKQRKYVDENLKAADLILSKKDIATLNTMELPVKGKRYNSQGLAFIDE